MYLVFIIVKNLLIFSKAFDWVVFIFSSFFNFINKNKNQ